MDRIDWCIKKAKAFEIVDQSENLSKAYLKKAENSLDAVSKLKGNIEWEMSSAYYAIYFSLYAILMMVGIKCENHGCTIEFARKFLKQFSKDQILCFEKARTYRVDPQYYTDREISKTDREKIVAEAPVIFIRCKEIINKLTEREIDAIRSEMMKQ